MFFAIERKPFKTLPRGAWLWDVPPSMSRRKASTDHQKIPPPVRGREPCRHCESPPPAAAGAVVVGVAITGDSFPFSGLARCLAANHLEPRRIRHFARPASPTFFAIFRERLLAAARDWSSKKRRKRKGSSGWGNRAPQVSCESRKRLGRGPIYRQKYSSCVDNRQLFFRIPNECRPRHTFLRLLQ